MIKGLLAFIGRLSGKEKVLLYGAAAAVFLLGLDQVMLRPIISEIDELDRKTRATETSVRHALALLKHKQKLALEKEEYKEYLKPPGEYKEEMMAIMKLIDDLCRDLDVVSKGVKDIRSKDESVSRIYRMRLTCEGEMRKLLDFMYAVEGSKKLLEIESWTMAPKNEGSKIVSCTMVVARTVILD